MIPRPKSPTVHWTSGLAPAGLLLLATACADPTAKFDEFVKRDLAARERDSGVAAPVEGELPTPEQIEGSYLYVVSLGLGATTPFVNLLELEAEMQGDMLFIRLRDRPLSYKDRATPVGEFTEWREFLANPKGKFETEPFNVVTPPEANPITMGLAVSDLVISGSLSTVERDDEGNVSFWCGKITGELTSPFPMPLNGNFTALRLYTPKDLKSYPFAEINCAHDRAAELPKK